MTGQNWPRLFRENIKRDMGAGARNERKLKSTEIIDQAAFGFFCSLPKQNISWNGKVRYRAIKTAGTAALARTFYQSIAANDFAIAAGISVLNRAYLQGCGIKGQFVTTIRAFALFEWHLVATGWTLEFAHVES